MVPLSEKTLDRLSRVFVPALREQAARLLETECAENLPFTQDTDPVKSERLRFAVMKLSEGRLDTLKKWIDEAKIDWRDVLMAAGFGYDVTEHERWNP
ncbi:MAG: hypothetical protein K1Y02_05920 [Candidatus Hydrogenedentes bacterium]|nr:hypothetical protein [Candidatus Hydrogenedentota bacterium]